MAGESRRFAEVGYLQQKFRLRAHGAPLFDHAVRSFSACFRTDSFLFVVRDGDAADFVAERCEALGVGRLAIVTLGAPTSGQAETVLLGLDKAGVPDDEAVTVFNIDTFRPGYVMPGLDPAYAGYLEVFRGTGKGWSFVAPDPRKAGDVLGVAEKLPISELCCTGLYHFRRAGDFRWAYLNPEPPRSSAERQERYVAPLYNALIARGDRIGMQLIDPGDVIFCGTPEQYEEAIVSEDIARRLRS
jgi:hypothetical protein